MEDKDIGQMLIQSARAESHASTTKFQDRNKVVLVRLSEHTDWISCVYLAQYPRLLFCVLFHIQQLLFFLSQ